MLTDLVNSLQNPSYQQVLHAREAIRVLLQRGGCALTDTEVSLRLLWIGDLQVLVPVEYHTELCAEWNHYWTALWRFRSECSHVLYVEKAYLSDLPGHQACARCGHIKVVAN